MRVILKLAVLTVLLPLPAAGQWQTEPPKPIPELVADFVRSPANSPVPLMASSCPEAGTWQRDLLRRLLALPIDEGRTRALAGDFAGSMLQCNIAELDQWYRDRLSDTKRSFSLSLLAGVLYGSGTEANKAAARRAVFDERLDGEMRWEMASRMIIQPGRLQGPDLPIVRPDAQSQLGLPGSSRVAEALDVIATGYREHGTDPPPDFLSHWVSVANDPSSPDYAVALAGKHKVLAALLSRPDGSGAVAILNSLISEAIAHPRDPWFRELGAAVQSIARGETPASAALRNFAAARAQRFGG